MSTSISVDRADRRLGFVGTGSMGRPMVTLLSRAGYQVTVYDKNPSAVAQLAANSGVQAASNLKDLAVASEVVITMLPDGASVHQVIQDKDGLAEHLSTGALIIDMTSSLPLATCELGTELSKRQIYLIDAPVSGGVLRADSGELTIMAGGEDAHIERARPVLEVMGTVVKTGPLGSGHAMKALNNFVSSIGLAAACEALLLGKTFGLSGETIVKILNSSTGRNFATENKLKQFILSETFASGFSLRLLAKDIQCAAALANSMHLELPFVQLSARLWSDAALKLRHDADHTEIYRYLSNLTEQRRVGQRD